MSVDGPDGGPSTTDGQHGDGLEALLLGPMQDDGDGGGRHSGGGQDAD